MGRVQEWERIRSEEVAEYDVFTVMRHTARSPRTADVHEFHVLDVPTCAIVIALTDDGQVVLVEQYRHAVQRASLEFPAGVIEAGEPPVDGALRELEEETGYCAGAASLLGEFDPDPAIQSNAVKVVVAEACTPDGTRAQDSGEDVQVRVVGADEIGALIDSGEIRSAPAITAWMLYQRQLSRR
jgi:ADP-ribose pyrophosphatase